MGNIFNDDFRDFILCLNNQKVEYIFVDGYALSFMDNDAEWLSCLYSSGLF
jgi:hypothetical protein